MGKCIIAALMLLASSLGYARQECAVADSDTYLAPPQAGAEVVRGPNQIRKGQRYEVGKVQDGWVAVDVDGEFAWAKASHFASSCRVETETSVSAEKKVEDRKLQTRKSAHHASDQGTANIASFANSLEEIRGECSQAASKLSGDFGTAELKQRLDSDLRRMKSRQDVQIYAIGNGRQQTTNYQLDRMKADSEADANDRQQLAKQRDEGSATVDACVETALEKGKTLYTTVKRDKKMREPATQLMTAWLVNTQSISFYSPSGSPQSNNDWKKAKASAELSGL